MLAGISDPHKQRARGCVIGAAPWIQQDETYAGVRLVRSWAAQSCGGKGCDARPGTATIGAALEAVVAGTEVDNVRVVRINRKALAEATSVLVATHAEWHGEDIPGRASVVGSQDGRRPGTVHSNCGVNDLRIAGVGSHALHSEVISLGHTVLQRNPALLTLLITINPPDVRAQVRETRLDRAEYDIG